MATDQSTKLPPVKAIQEVLNISDDVAQRLSGLGPMNFSGMANSPSSTLAEIAELVQSMGGNVFLEIHGVGESFDHVISFKIDNEGYLTRDA